MLQHMLPHSSEQVLFIYMSAWLLLLLVNLLLISTLQSFSVCHKG